MRARGCYCCYLGFAGGLRLHSVWLYGTRGARDDQDMSVVGLKIIEGSRHVLYIWVRKILKTNRKLKATIIDVHRYVLKC